MGMFSEIVTEETLRAILKRMKSDILENSGKPEACEAIKKIGRFALTLFEGGMPKWAEEYQKLFDNDGQIPSDNLSDFDYKLIKNVRHVEPPEFVELAFKGSLRNLRSTSSGMLSGYTKTGELVWTYDRLLSLCLP